MAEVDKETFDVSREALGIPDGEQRPGDHDTSKVVEGQVTRKKKTKIQKVAETFFGGDLRDVASYVIMDVAIPSIKDMVFDTFTQGLSRLMYGEVRSTRRSGYRNQGYTSYGSMSRDNRREREIEVRRSRNDFDDVMFKDRRDAEKVIDNLRDTIDHYGQCSVADFLKASGITPSYTDYDTGWRDLTRTSISRLRDGYVINLPKTEDIR